MDYIISFLFLLYDTIQSFTSVHEIFQYYHFDNIDRFQVLYVVLQFSN